MTERGTGRVLGHQIEGVSPIDAVGRYLIVGGVYKAGTTSLYAYLADHPEICASRVKETRYFLDHDYPVRRSYDYRREADAYVRFFANCPEGALRMEATPFYLYSPGTPHRIRRSLPNARIVFCLREPVDRLRSCFRFEREASGSSDRTFDDYVRRLERQLAAQPACANANQLAMGRYAAHVARYMDTFGAERILVVYHEDLVRSPAAVIRDVCGLTGLDPAPYAQYTFRVHNPTRPTRAGPIRAASRPLRQLRERAARYSLRAGGVHEAARRLKATIEPAFDRIGRVPPEPVEVAEDTLAFLRDFYAEDGHALASLLGAPPAWCRPAASGGWR